MGGLQRFEQRLENLISGVFARTFRSAVQPVEIASALERELDNNAQILSRQRRLVPNTFHVELSASDLDRLAGMDSTLARELTSMVKKHAQEQGYVFPGPVAIDFAEDAELTTGRFRVRSQAQAEVQGGVRQGHLPPYGGDSGSRTSVVLEVNGTRHPLEPPSLVIGRGSDADLRINDPGISRRHLEFMVTYPRPDPTDYAADDPEPEVEVHDLGSTNGIKVDGRKVPRARLVDGSTVTAGNTTMIVRLRREDGGA